MFLSNFKRPNKVLCVTYRPMDRDYLIGARVYYDPQPHGWVPSIVKNHARLLGVSLYFLSDIKVRVSR